MINFLSSQGAELGSHSNVRLAEADFNDLSEIDLLHYQRVLEAVVDNPHPLMSHGALKEELATVVQERIARGYVDDTTSEVKAFRRRIALLEVQ